MPDDWGGGGGGGGGARGGGAKTKQGTPHKDLVAIKIKVIESNVDTHLSFSVNNS
jgi:hypothetical protein